MSQLSIEFEERKFDLTLNHLPQGSVFKKQDSAAAYMKVKPVNFLNNSNLLADVFARGDCVVINLHKGTCFVMDGQTKVIKMTGKMQLKIANGGADAI
jgi:hypothetical protein